MAKVIFEGECCSDCLLTIANGECWSDDRDIAVEQAARIAREWPTAHLAVGDQTDEFSRAECDACGSRLAGERHQFFALE